MPGMNLKQKKYIESLYLEMYDRLMIYAHVNLDSDSLAEEAVQETFRIACQKPESLCSSPNPQGWLVNTLKNTIRNMKQTRITAKRILDTYMMVQLKELSVTYLQNLKAQQDHRRTMPNYIHDWDDFVCVKKNGDLLRPGYVTQAFPDLCEQCGLRRIKLHELRHTNISLLHSGGASLKELQSWSGHARFATTMNVYTHIVDQGKAKLTNTISSILG